MNIGFVALTDAGWSTERNVESIENGDHDPKVRGFTVPNAEISLDGAVDPYFKGVANLVWKIDSEGETGVELEEAYALTTSLPANLQLKFGQFFAEFGRQNPQHPHSWAFVDQPIVMSRMFGAEGLRSQGLRLSWLLPTSFYSEAMIAVMNSTGGTTYSFRSEDSPEIHGGEVVDRRVDGFGDMLIVRDLQPRSISRRLKQWSSACRVHSVRTMPEDPQERKSLERTHTGSGSPRQLRRDSPSFPFKAKRWSDATRRPSASRPSCRRWFGRRRQSRIGAHTRSCYGV
jgi:hypothetical protein